MAAADFVIALMMCYYLHQSRVATNFSTTASLLLGLIRLVVASGLITGACSLFILISYIVWPDTLIFLGIYFILSKLYINSVLAMFNYRSEPLESNRLNSERIPKSNPTVLRITPHTSEGSTAGTNISIPLSDIEDLPSLENKLDDSKGALDHSDRV